MSVVTVTALETGDGHVLAGLQVQAVQVLDAPQNVPLGDGAHILAVAFQHGDGGKALVRPFFQRLTQGEILVNVQNILFGSKEKQKVHAKMALLFLCDGKSVTELSYF